LCSSKPWKNYHGLFVKNGEVRQSIEEDQFIQNARKADALPNMILHYGVLDKHMAG
jgi:hypothetical protein